MKMTFHSLDAEMAKIESRLQQPLSVRKNRLLVKRLARLKEEQAKILATPALA